MSVRTHLSKPLPMMNALIEMKTPHRFGAGFFMPKSLDEIDLSLAESALSGRGFRDFSETKTLVHSFRGDGG